jgi:hypothetical protein
MSLFAGIVPAIAIYFHNVLVFRVLAMIAAVFRIVANRAVACGMRAFIIVCHFRISLCSFLDFVKKPEAFPYIGKTASFLVAIWKL